MKSILEKLKSFLSKKFESLKWVLSFLFILFILVPVSLFLIYSFSVSTQYIWMGNIASTFLVTFLLIITTIIVFSIFVETIFRIFFYILNKRFFVPSKRIKYDQLYVESNPYIPYKFKSSFKNEKESLADYPLHKGEIFFGNYETNNLGYLNGPNGDRDVEFKIKENLIRVNCLGASTTGNYIKKDNKDFSYPNELEKILNKDSLKYEVNNFGVGGYNSADILVNFILNIVDTRPEIIILYHAYNDIDSYLTDNIKSDYSHSRKNLGETIWKFKLSEKIPTFPLSFMNYIAENIFPIVPRNSLIKNITKGKRDLRIDPKKGLEIYERNIQSIIDIAKARNIKVILSSFCHFLYDEISDSELHRTHHKIVKQENEIILNLSRKNNLIFVDNYKKIPKEKRYFVDSIHFSPEGIKSIAKNFADAITE